jgi:hypothetical protein
MQDSFGFSSVVLGIYNFDVPFESFLCCFCSKEDFVIGRIPKAVCRELTTLSVTINLRPIVLFSARKPTRRHKYDQDEVRSIFSFILAAICNDYHLLLSSTALPSYHALPSW